MRVFSTLRIFIEIHILSDIGENTAQLIFSFFKNLSPIYQKLLIMILSLDIKDLPIFYTLSSLEIHSLELNYLYQFIWVFTSIFFNIPKDRNLDIRWCSCKVTTWQTHVSCVVVCAFQGSGSSHAVVSSSICFLINVLNTSFVCMWSLCDAISFLFYISILYFYCVRYFRQCSLIKNSVEQDQSGVENTATVV